MSEANVAPEVTEVPTEQAEANPASAEPKQSKEAAPKPAEVKKFIAQYNGKDVELPVDLEELLRQHQIMPNARKELTKAQKMAKDAQDLISFAKSDPMKFLSHPQIGVDVKQWMMERLAEEAEEATMSEEGRELRKAKRELDDFKSKAKEQEEQAHQQQVQQLREKFQAEIEQGLIKGCETHGLKPFPHIFQRAAGYMQQALDQQYDLKPEDAIALVKEDLRNEMLMFYDKTPEEMLLSMLGDERVNKIVKGQTAKLKKAGVSQSKVEGEPTRTPDKPRQKMTAQEFRKKMGG